MKFTSRRPGSLVTGGFDPPLSPRASRRRSGGRLPRQRARLAESAQLEHFEARTGARYSTVAAVRGELEENAQLGHSPTRVTGTDKTVTAVRSDLVENAEIPNSPIRITADGKPAPGPKPASKPKAKPRSLMGWWTRWWSGTRRATL